MARRFPLSTYRDFIAPNSVQQGRTIAVRPMRGDLPECIQPAMVDLESIPLPVAPVVPHVECVQERIAVEIMRGCPGKCRFCQSTTTKRPLRFRKVGNHCPGGLGVVSQHRVQRNFAALAFQQRLSAIRRAFTATARDPATAGRGHLAAQPANQRGIANGRRFDRHRPAFRIDACTRGRPGRHAQANRQANCQRRPLCRVPKGL